MYMELSGMEEDIVVNGGMYFCAMIEVMDMEIGCFLIVIGEE